MKIILKDHLKIVLYAIFGIVLVMSSYTIILNVNHYKSLSKTTIVSEIDNDYSIYKKNVNLIEKYLEEHEFKDNKIYLSLSKVLNGMKSNGVYRLIPKTKLNNKDLYELNNYFMEELINNGWISTIKEYEVSNNYQDSIDLIINNSNYLNQILINNGLVLYDSSLDNKVEDNYHFLLSNYMMYSKVILNICNELGGTNG